MTRSHDALYRAICAHPDEDTPRLAFADLVEEDGDPDRAHFIRTQVALARSAAYDPAAVAARHADPDAVAGHGLVHTLPPLPGGFGWNAFEFRRGFPWKCAALSADVFAGGGGVFEAAPIQALLVHPSTRHDVAALADWPHLSRVRRLEFSTARLAADDAARLGDAPHAAALTELALEFDAVTADGLEALARSAAFPRLEVLELRANLVPPALVADALAAARGPGSLDRLVLSSARVTGDDAAHLFALPLLHGLRHLDLSDNPLRAEGVAALAESRALRGLRVLDLGRTFPGVPGVRALTEAPGLAGVRSLDLSWSRLGPVAVKLVAESAAARGLRVLNLSGNPVGDAGAAAVANSRALAGLLDLDLADADLSDAGAVALADSPYLGNLLRLNLADRSGRPLGATARAALRDRFGRRVSV
ncbi:MAG: hypothetical protein C0501_07190 [Isosphaera sp.]|nr:hypothetical protein [Isosphaera sp.]